jgi:hypothetical protein
METGLSRSSQRGHNGRQNDSKMRVRTNLYCADSIGFCPPTVQISRDMNSKASAEIIGKLLCICYVQNGAKMGSRKGGVNPVPFGELPSRINKGRILVHNNVEHSVNTTCGRNGFLAWTQPEPAPEGFVKCNCGWAGLPHYSKPTSGGLISDG